MAPRPRTTRRAEPKRGPIVPEDLTRIAFLSAPRVAPDIVFE